MKRHGKLVRVEPPKLDRRYVLILPGMWGLLGFDVDRVSPVTVDSRLVAWQGIVDDVPICQFPYDEPYRLVPTSQVTLAGPLEGDEDDDDAADGGSPSGDDNLRRGYI